MTCTISGCVRARIARGLCPAHYSRWRIGHDPNGPRRSGVPPRPLAERFWEKVDRSAGPDGCWLWLGCQKRGYGVVWVDGGRRAGIAHRVAYELLVGPVPPGLVLDHYRLNEGPRQAPCSTLCVNPAHVEPCTSIENVLRSSRTPYRVKAALTHCKRGHPFDETNTKHSGDGRRACRACSASYEQSRPSRSHARADHPKAVAR